MKMTITARAYCVVYKAENQQLYHGSILTAVIYLKYDVVV